MKKRKPVLVWNPTVDYLVRNYEARRDDDSVRRLRSRLERAGRVLPGWSSTTPTSSR